jgi:plasmid stabilization system protein ParE
MYDVELSDEAIADYESAVTWYEEQKRSLGFDFSVRLSDVFTDIAEQPSAQRFLFKNCRFAFVKQFPFKVYFFVDEANLSIIVFAILHEKRSPQVWQKRSSRFILVVLQTPS